MGINKVKKFLVLTIVFFLFNMIFFPSSGIQIDNKPFINPSKGGNTLYVGGNGSGNYSKIQDAIDDAVDGDTVFVYSKNPWYIEWDIQINKSINFIGEDKNTTIVNAIGYGTILNIINDRVNVSGFTFIEGNGIFAYDCKNIRISDNHFLNGFYGIELEYTDESYIISNSFNGFDIPIKCFVCGAITISNNYINSSIHDGEGIYGDISCWCGKLVITNNTLIAMNEGEFRIGMYLELVDGCIIQGNNIIGYDKSGTAIEFWMSSNNNIISHNNIENNCNGIWGIKRSNRLTNNNFINNRYDIGFPLFSYNNYYEGNYWDDWIGLKYKHPFFQRFPKIIRVSVFGFATDWHPAKEPYDI